MFFYYQKKNVNYCKKLQTIVINIIIVINIRRYKLLT